jgi:cobyrinic acid a,c-diamide synthase
MSGRILLAGTQSSAGKTTVMLGLLGALHARGARVAPFKAGPDYIDPSLHAQAAGCPSRNLDPWLLDAAALRGVLARGARAADLALIEGVMGLFDGIGSTQDGSTAAVARALACPVVLVLDVAAMSGTAAAIVLGCQRLEPSVELVGVVLNRVGSDAHAAATGDAIRAATGLPVLGSLPDEPQLALPERHLGLVPAAEGGAPRAVLDRLAALVGQRFDLARLERLAGAAPALEGPHGDPGVAMGSLEPPLLAGDAPTVRARIAVARDRAFGFYYQDTIDLLADVGAEVVDFSPLRDRALPDGADGVYLGGGFPELYADELAANRPLRAALRAHAARGRPIYGECGGLMALGRSLTTFGGRRRPMFGLLPVDTRMTRERLTIGYREVEAVADTPLLRAGERLRGHEFHWSEADPPPPERAVYRLVGSERLEGYRAGATLGSYVHLNLAGAPHVARRFVAACAAGHENAW